MTAIALIDESTGVDGGDLFGMASALEQSARHCADAWGIAPPTVELWMDRKPLPRGFWPLYFVDETSDSADTLAVHYVSAGRPTGRVYVGNASGLIEGRNSVCEAASHEVVEMLVNPRIDKWVNAPGRPGWQVALEVADPVQDHYEVEVDGIAWKVANFVKPAWFDTRSTSGMSMDRLGTVLDPGQIGTEGYLILRNPAGIIEYAFGATKESMRLGIRGTRVVGGPSAWPTATHEP